MLFSVLDHFVSSLLKTRSSRSDSGVSQNQLSGVEDSPVRREPKVLNLEPGTSASSSGLPGYSSDGLHKCLSLFRNAEANLQCTNINVFTCHEQTGRKPVEMLGAFGQYRWLFVLIHNCTCCVAVGAMLRLDTLSFQQRLADMSLSCHGFKVTQFPVEGKVSFVFVLRFRARFELETAT